MSGVEAELELPIEGALSAIDSIDAALGEVVTNFQIGLLDAVDALAGASVTAEVEADTTQAEEAVAALDAQEPQIEGEATVDTAEAQSNIDALSSSSDGATASLAQTGESAAVAQGALAGAGGSAANLGSAFTKMSGAGAAAAILGVGAAAGVLFTQALDAQAATERFEATFGNLAASVDRINVGSLNTDLSDLALTLGSDDDALRQAASSFFVMGDAAGVARPEVARTTEEVIALAARAVAPNPSLGSVDEVASRMTRGLATGGRFASMFGLSLNRAEIEARALQMTGKSSADQLEQYERVAAGAAIATDKYGSSLAKSITTGAANAQVVLARTRQTFEEIVEEAGAPLVMPILESLEALLPVATAVGGAVGTVLGASLQLISPLLSAAAALVTPFADGLMFTSDALALMPPEVWLGIGAAVAVLYVALTGLTQALVANAIAFATNPVTIWIAAIAAAVTAVGVLGKALFGGGESAAEAREETKGLVGELKGLDAGAAAAKFLNAEVDTAALKARQAAAGNRELSTSADVVRRSYENAGVAIGVAGEKAAASFRDARRDLGLLAAESPAQARQVLAGIQELGTASGFTREELRSLSGVVDTGTESFQKHAAETANATAADQALTDAATALQDRIAALAQTIPATLPSAAAGFQQFGQAVQEAFNGATPSVDQFIGNLQSSVAGVQTWLSGIQRLILAGLPGLAALVQSSGQEIGTALLTEIEAATPETRAAWNAQLEAGIVAVDQQSGALDAAGKNAATMMLGGMKQVVPGASGVGSQAGIGLGQSFTGTAVPGAGAAVNAAGAAVSGGATGLANPAYQAGALVGAQFGDGIVGGIASRSGSVAAAARALVDIAVAAGRRAAEAASPSKRAEREIGEPIGAGIAAGMMHQQALIAGASQALIAAAIPATIGVAGVEGLRGSPTVAVGGTAGRPLIGTQIIQALDARDAADRVGRELVYTQRLVRVGR